jgi:hypothetical protein
MSIKKLITQAIQQAPSADNSQPWHVSWELDKLSLTYDSKRVGTTTFPANSPATLLSIGAAIENIHQVTNALNADLHIDIASQIDNDNPCYLKARVKQPSSEHEDLAETLPVFKRHTNRLPYSSQAIEDSILVHLKNQMLGDAKVCIFTEQKQITSIAKLVQKASEIRFKTREINEWLGKSLRFGSEAEKSKDGLDIATLDLPPGGGLFLRVISNWKIMKIFNFFGAHLALSIIDSAPVKKAPAIIAITSSSSVKGLMEAGQLMEKTWIDLNDKGVAVHPYYVISDQIYRKKIGVIPKGLEKKADAIFSESQQLFQLKEDETLQMLLRIGYPEKTAKHSKRLPFDRFCSGL